MNVVPDPHSLLHQPSSKKDTASDSSRVDFAISPCLGDASMLLRSQVAKAHIDDVSPASCFAMDLDTRNRRSVSSKTNLFLHAQSHFPIRLKE